MGQARQKRIHRQQRLANLEERIGVLLKLPSQQIKALEVMLPERDLDVGDHHVQLGRYRRILVIDEVHHMNGGIVADCTAYRHDGSLDTEVFWQIQTGCKINIIPANAVPLNAVPLSTAPLEPSGRQ